MKIKARYKLIILGTLIIPLLLNLTLIEERESLPEDFKTYDKLAKKYYDRDSLYNFNVVMYNSMFGMMYLFTIIIMHTNQPKNHKITEFNEKQNHRNVDHG